MTTNKKTWIIIIIIKYITKHRGIYVPDRGLTDIMQYSLSGVKNIIIIIILFLLLFFFIFSFIFSLIISFIFYQYYNYNHYYHYQIY